jgi:hypothetical protein
MKQSPSGETNCRSASSGNRRFVLLFVLLFRRAIEESPCRKLLHKPEGTRRVGYQASDWIQLKMI